MKKVLLKVIGRQELDDDFDETKLYTVGTIDETDGTVNIKYTEQLEPPLKDINVDIVISADERCVHMTRSGERNSLLVIETAQRNLCQYGTEYGDLLLGTSGHSIEHSRDENGGGEITIIYTLDINGAVTSENTVRIKYRMLEKQNA